MELKSIIVHNLKKEANSNTAIIEPSENVLPVNDSSINLITELNKRYNSHRQKITYATFDDENDDNKFYTEFKRYFTDRDEDALLINFSKESVKDLKARVETNKNIKGGYLIFANYHDNNNFIGIFLVRNTNGILFTRDPETNTFKINPSIHIDFEKISMACRINVVNYTIKSGKYLSFLSVRSDEVSKFFNKWINAKELEDNVVLTKTLKNEVLAKIDLPENFSDREEFMKSVQEHIRRQANRWVNIKELGQFFYSNENEIVNFVNENNVELDTEFKADPTELKKFTRTSVAADKIDLKFPRNYYKNKIRIESSHPNLIVIDSEELANKIKQEFTDV